MHYFERLQKPSCCIGEGPECFSNATFWPSRQGKIKNCCSNQNTAHQSFLRSYKLTLHVGDHCSQFTLVLPTPEKMLVSTYILNICYKGPQFYVAPSSHSTLGTIAHSLPLPFFFFLTHLP